MYVEKIVRMWDGFAGLEKVYDVLDDENKEVMEKAAETVYKFVTEKSEGVDERFWDALSGAKNRATLMYLFNTVRREDVTYDEVARVVDAFMALRNSIETIIEMYDDFFAKFRGVIYAFMSFSDIDKILFVWAMDRINRKQSYDDVLRVISNFDKEGCSICDIKKIVDDEELVKAYKILYDIFKEVKGNACC